MFKYRISGTEAVLWMAPKVAGTCGALPRLSPMVRLRSGGGTLRSTGSTVTTAMVDMIINMC